jgi:outer membrane protein
MVLLAGATFLAPVAAYAEGAGKKAGDFMVRGRVIGVVPQESSDITAIGGDVDASDEVVPEVDFSYFLTDNIAVELIAATTRHRIKAKNTALGEVDVGKVRLLPPTLTVQYHFWPKQAFSPYLGAGINYTLFFDEKVPGTTVTSVKYDNAVGVAFQAGFDYNITGNWYFNVDVKQLLLNTTAKINGGAVEADVDLNPTIIGVGFGYKF